MEGDDVFFGGWGIFVQGERVFFKFKTKIKNTPRFWRCWGTGEGGLQGYADYKLPIFARAGARGLAGGESKLGFFVPFTFSVRPTKLAHL